MEVKGRDLVTGIPQNIIITSEEVRKAISEQVDSIVQAVRIALEQTPPELAFPRHCGPGHCAHRWRCVAQGPGPASARRKPRCPSQWWMTLYGGRRHRQSPRQYPYPEGGLRRLTRARSDALWGESSSSSLGISLFILEQPHRPLTIWPPTAGLKPLVIFCVPPFGCETLSTATGANIWRWWIGRRKTPACATSCSAWSSILLPCAKTWPNSPLARTLPLSGTARLDTIRHPRAGRAFRPSFRPGKHHAGPGALATGASPEPPSSPTRA